MTAPLPPRYQPAEVEPRVARRWEQAACFHAEPDTPGEPYCIMIPPPNVTDRLHVGHALNNTLQDALVRFRRMQGRSTLWLPGTDHAGIATQTVVEKRILAEEGRRRTDFERDEFVARIQGWKDEYEATITRQLQRMGCSCDWDRQRFTMDDVCARAVREAFFQLFRDGLIYRGKRLVNWDPATQTVLADDEVEHEEVRGRFWYLRYPLVKPVDVGGERIEHVTVATTRPETMLGDTAVAMHPADPRADALVGRSVRLPIVGRIIPLIADDHVVLPDPDSDDEKARFSTGFLKVTPAHDSDDYAIGERHNLPRINVLAPDGTVSDRHGWDDADAPEAQNLIGMDRFEAREAIVEWFRQEGLLEDDCEYVHPVGHSYRSHVPIEPYLSDQWYVAVKKPIDRLAGTFGEGRIGGTDVPRNSLAGLALAPLLDGRLRFVPDRYAKTYQTWLGNLRDWPISRQLWWGHRIPVWAGPGGAERFSSEHCATLPGSDETDGTRTSYACPAAGSRDCEEELEAAGFVRDPDVLDTWFSSALWPFSTLGWPERTPELKAFYPGDVLCTAREIITLWVSRMVMMGQYALGEPPFPVVFIHAMIQDGEGRKMSKSLGNGIDPLDIIDSHGADAMRFTLLSMTTQTQDVRMPVEETTLPDGRTANTSPKFDLGRNFANKLWNAARFALMNLGAGAPAIDRNRLEFEDRWILSRRNAAVRAVSDALESFRFNDAAQTLYDFTWHDVCDWYVEIIKPRLADPEAGGQARAVLAFVLDTALRLLHPLMPFITEELWAHLNEAVPARGFDDPAPTEEVLAAAEWPEPSEGLDRADLEEQMAGAQAVIRAVRNVRSRMGIAAKTPLDALVSSSDPAERAAVERSEDFIRHLAGLSNITVGEDLKKPRRAAAEVVGRTEVYVPLVGLIDLDAERSRLEKRLAEARDKLAGVETKLSNEAFVSKAPAEIVERERAKAADLRDQVDSLERNLGELA
jgi:valyl-tRNA synthetase